MNAPFIPDAEAPGAVVAALAIVPALRRSNGFASTFSPAPIHRNLFRVNANVIRRMVESGQLEWVNDCRSAVRRARSAT